MTPGWQAIVCVDWGKELGKRRAWVADVAARRVRRLAVEPRVPALLGWAAEQPGPVLIGIDAALGVPAPYFARAREVIPADGFLPWIAAACTRAAFLEEARVSSEWRHDRPFIRVPGVTGGLRAFWSVAGGPLLREVDRATGAKSAFIVAGIPGTVGSGTRALWCELAPLLAGERDFAVWPFEAAAGGPVLAEIYPRVCYGLALAPSLPAPLLRLAKTHASVQEAAVQDLLGAAWVREHGVDLARPAAGDEDDFDAMISAAALLRCTLAGLPAPARSDPIEGGIWGLEWITPRTRRRARSGPGG